MVCHTVVWEVKLVQGTRLHTLALRILNWSTFLILRDCGASCRHKSLVTSFLLLQSSFISLQILLFLGHLLLSRQQGLLNASYLARRHHGIAWLHHWLLLSRLHTWWHLHLYSHRLLRLQRHWIICTRHLWHHRLKSTSVLLLRRHSHWISRRPRHRWHHRLKSTAVLLRRLHRSSISHPRNLWHLRLVRLKSCAVGVRIIRFLFLIRGIEGIVRLTVLLWHFYN